MPFGFKWHIYLFHIYYNHLTSNVHFIKIIALHCVYYDLYICNIDVFVTIFAGTQFHIIVIRTDALKWFDIALFST